MIKFFRKIRYDLMEKKATDPGSRAGKTGKPALPSGRYLKYAIGEIVLVVLGILIALSINNWNEERKQTISEEEFIAGIKNDLKQDQNYIDLILKIGETKIKAYNILNNELTELYTNDKNKLDSLLQIYFIDNRTFYPISGSFKSAISGNELNKFKNKKVISEIVKLYDSKYNRLIDNGKILDNRFEFILKKYTQVRRKGHFRDMTLTETSELLDDIFYYFKQLSYYITELKDVSNEINAIAN